MSLSPKRGLSPPDFPTKFRMFHIPPTSTAGDSSNTNRTKWSTYDGIDFENDIRHNLEQPSAVV